MLGAGVCGSRPRNGEINWKKQEESGTGEGVLTLVKLEQNINTSNSSIKQYLVLAEIHLDFDS